MAEHTDVAVIGAGPAGLAVGACLRKAGLNFVIFERAQKLASSWHRHYERLHLHTVKQLSSLPYVPFPATYPRYVPKNLVIAYLESYASNFDLQPRFGDAVRIVRRDGNDWLIEGALSSVRARHVVIASGFNAEPVMPSIPGIEKFRSKVIHSAQYVNAEPFAGQDVLVIGMGNTGAEVALDLCEGGARTSISLRDGVHIVPRELLRHSDSDRRNARDQSAPFAVERKTFPGHSRFGSRRPLEAWDQATERRHFATGCEFVQNSGHRRWHGAKNLRRSDQDTAGNLHNR